MLIESAKENHWALKFSQRTSRQRTEKQGHYFAYIGQYSQSYGFSSSLVWMWEMQGKKCWALKNQCSFELWCWRRLLRGPWTARRSNQSILKKINLEHSSEGLMLKLKLQYFGHLMRRADLLEKTLMLGRVEGRRRRRWQRMKWLDGIINSIDLSMGKLQEMVRDRGTWHAAVHGSQKSGTQPSDWTTTDSPSSLSRNQFNGCRNYTASGHCNRTSDEAVDFWSKAPLSTSGRSRIPILYPSHLLKKRERRKKFGNNAFLLKREWDKLLKNCRDKFATLKYLHRSSWRWIHEV